MKTRNIILTIIFILIGQISLSAQTFDLAKFIEETQVVAEKTTSQALFEFSYDFKRTGGKKGGKISTETYESVCSEKHCEYILLEKANKSFSAEEVARNRQKAAAKLEKFEKSSKTDFFFTREFVPPYDFLLFEKINVIKLYFNPNFYLKNCKINFVEKSPLENRETIKISATNCKADSGNDKKLSFTLPKSEALIWIDEKDKAVVRLEIYAENEINSIDSTIKPTVTLETLLVPEGFWFWKIITINTENKKFFKRKSDNRKENSGNRKFEFYNYKKFSVEINKAEVDKKSN